jgi:hypothetical protein
MESKCKVGLIQFLLINRNIGTKKIIISSFWNITYDYVLYDEVLKKLQKLHIC